MNDNIVSTRKYPRRALSNRGYTDLLLFAAALPAFAFLLAAVVDLSRVIIIKGNIREALAIASQTFSVPTDDSTYQTGSSLPVASIPLCLDSPHNPFHDIGQCIVSDTAAADNVGILSVPVATRIANRICESINSKITSNSQLFLEPEDLKIMTLVVAEANWGELIILGQTGGSGSGAHCVDLASMDEDIPLLGPISDILKNQLVDITPTKEVATPFFGFYVFSFVHARVNSFIGSLILPVEGGNTTDHIHAFSLYTFPSHFGLQPPTSMVSPPSGGDSG